MAPFTGQLRTSQEKKIPAPTDSTYRWQREYVEYFEEPAWGVCWTTGLTLSDRVCIINSRLGNVTLSLYVGPFARKWITAKSKVSGQWKLSHSMFLFFSFFLFLLLFFFVVFFFFIIHCYWTISLQPLFCLLQPFLPVFSSNTHACKHKYIHYICSILHT